MIIHILESVGATKPRFKIGEWVPLGNRYQLWENVTVYGRINGLQWTGEWNYLIHPPEDHPYRWDIDSPYESELLQRCHGDLGRKTSKP